jgi:DNA-binding transcriptional LysR family regulator
MHRPTAAYADGMAKGKEINWDDLRYLRAALKAGSLAGAARALRVEHTTIGRRLSALERSLGAAVVVRGPDGLRPTSVGAALAPLLDDIDRVVEQAREMAIARRSHVRLATPSGFAPFFTATMSKLRAEHPEISLEIISGAKPVDLQKGEADLALRIGPIGDDNLVAKKICDAGWALYASKAYLERKGQPSDDLRGHEIIGYDENMARSPPAQWLAEHARDATVVMRSREMVDMCAAAVSGVGVAVLPCSLGDGEPALCRLTADAIATRPVSIVYRRDGRVSSTLKTVIRFVTETVGAHADRLAGVRR